MCIVGTFFASLEELLGTEEANIRSRNVSSRSVKVDLVPFGVTNSLIDKTNSSNCNGCTTDAMDGSISKFTVGVKFKVINVVQG